MTPAPEDLALAKTILQFQYDAIYGAPEVGAVAQMIAERTQVKDPAILAKVEYRRGNAVPVTSLTWEEYAHELESLVKDHEEVHEDKRRLVRQIDVILNGEEGAAKQASLCDVVAQIRDMAEQIAEIHDIVEARAEEAKMLDELNLELARLAAEEREKNAIIP